MNGKIDREATQLPPTVDERHPIHKKMILQCDSSSLDAGSK